MGGLCDIVNNVLIEARVDFAAGRLASVEWLQPTATRGGLKAAILLPWEHSDLSLVRDQRVLPGSVYFV